MPARSNPQEVSLEVSNSLQRLRILELPPELDDLLSRSDPPALQFKSSPSQNCSSTNSVIGSQSLHLCSPTHTYQIRQVSTSNSVYVLRATGNETQDVESMEIDRPSTPTGVKAIAIVDSVLELVPISYNVGSLLAPMLPVCEPEDHLDEAAAMKYFVTQSVPMNQTEVFADVPAPVSQCEDAWNDLLAFELDGRCARAGPERALELYRSLFNYFLINKPGMDLARTGFDLGGFREEDAVSALDNAILESLLRYLDGGTAITSETGHYQLDKSRMIEWTGKTYLQTRSDKSVALSKTDFIRVWNDILPKSCARKETDELPSDVREKIQGGETVVYHQSSGEDLPTSAQKEQKPASTGKRKWHEKFKAQRKDAKR